MYIYFIRVSSQRLIRQVVAIGRRLHSELARLPLQDKLPDEENITTVKDV